MESKKTKFQAFRHSAVWPSEDSEPVHACPMCESSRRTLAHSEVRDWAFSCAPGSWTYWECDDCRSLYLHPRPTVESIGRAYANYYTHEEPGDQKNGPTLRQRLRNECMFHWFGIEQEPRFHQRFWGHVKMLKAVIPPKFPLEQLSSLTCGTLLDVGCGSGDFLMAAERMGWQVQGIEIDEKAVLAARQKNLVVRHGSFELVHEYINEFDCIVCSHVVEHVHQPRELLLGIVNALKPGGRLFISYPNPRSCVRSWFGRYWRGLEAPRHLCLPSIQALESELNKMGIRNIRIYASSIHTFEASVRAKFGRAGFFVRGINKFLNVATSIMPMSKNQDLVEVMCESAN